MCFIAANISFLFKTIRATHHFTNDSEASYPLPLQQKVEDVQHDIYEDESTTSQAQRDHKRKHRESGMLIL